METIVGLLIWGGLLVLVSRWVLRSYRGPSRKAAVTSTPPAAPTGRPPVAPAALEASDREAGALVDGLIIGHHLTRTHYQDRLDDQAETIDVLRAEVAADSYLGDDDLDEDLDEADTEELEGMSGADDPWDDDIYGDDED